MCVDPATAVFIATAVPAGGTQAAGAYQPGPLQGARARRSWVAAGESAHLQTGEESA